MSNEGRDSACRARTAICIVLGLLFVTSFFHDFSVIESIADEQTSRAKFSFVIYKASLAAQEGNDNDDGFQNVTTPSPVDGSDEEGEEISWNLRFDWTNLTRHSEVAKRIHEHQTNCSLPFANMMSRNRFGLGADLHVWSQFIFSGMEMEIPVRVRMALPWIYRDEHACSSNDMSALECYFPHADLQCPGDREIAARCPRATEDCKNVTNMGKFPHIPSPKIVKQFGISNMRGGAIEYLFTRTSRVVIEEAERQLKTVFGSGKQHLPSNNGTGTRTAPKMTAVPEKLVVVHIRWGDKSDEMSLVPIQPYIDAVTEIEKKRQEKASQTIPLSLSLTNNSIAMKDDAPEPVNIFLATEDPKAVDAFATHAPDHWNVWVDQYFFDLLPFRKGDEYNGNPKVAREQQGRTGLIALASILVALEADDFVLTTESNWSRIMNELRLFVVEPRCSERNCTSMIDLRPVRREWR